MPQQCLRKNPIHEDVSWLHWNCNMVYFSHQPQHLIFSHSLPCWRLISNMPSGNRMGILAWIHWWSDPWIFFNFKSINHPRASGGKQLAISLPEDAASWLLILSVLPQKKINLKLWFFWFYSCVFPILWCIYLYRARLVDVFCFISFWLPFRIVHIPIQPRSHAAQAPWSNDSWMDNPADKPAKWRVCGRNLWCTLFYVASKWLYKYVGVLWVVNHLQPHIFV